MMKLGRSLWTFAIDYRTRTRKGGWRKKTIGRTVFCPTPAAARNVAADTAVNVERRGDRPFAIRVFKEARA